MARITDDIKESKEASVLSAYLKEDELEELLEEIEEDGLGVIEDVTLYYPCNDKKLNIIKDDE